jgi:hypothetical protein
MIGQLPWTPVSAVPSLTTTIAWSPNTSILHIVVPLWWRGGGGAERGDWKLVH